MLPAGEMEFCAGHGTHADSDVDPVTGRYLPSWHSVQTEDAVPANEPSGHSMQLSDARSEYWPSRHFAHPRRWLPAYPSTQTQAEADALAEGEVAFAWQDMHPVEPDVDEYVPASHTEHVDEPLYAENLPASHRQHACVSP